MIFPPQQSNSCHLQAFFGTPNAVALDLVAQALRSGAQGISDQFPQVRMLDMYTLFAVSSGEIVWRAHGWCGCYN